MKLARPGLSIATPLRNEKKWPERPLLIELISRNTGMVYGGVGVVDCGLPSYF